MAQRALKPGEFGDITTSATSDGKRRARCYYRDNTGTRIRLEARGKTDAAAKRALKEKIADRGKGLTTEKTTWSDFSDLWLDHALTTRGLRPQSADRYRIALNTHLIPRIGQLPIGKITRSLISQTLDDIYTTSPGSYHACLNISRQILAHAVRRDYLTYSPLDVYERITVRPPEVRALTIEELAELRGMVKAWEEGGKLRTTPLADLMDLILSTAIRIGEALALPIDNVDLDRRTVLIDRTQVKIKGQGVVMQRETKESKILLIPLTDFGYDMLKRRIDQARPGQEFVFESSSGRMRGAHTVFTAWKQARGEKYGWVSMKTFRKSVATLAAGELGSQAAALALGHSSDAVTKRHYIDERGPILVPDITAVLEALAGPKATHNNDGSTRA